MDQLLGFTYFALSLLIVLTIHEASHALVAYYLGDSTAKLEGRVTLNPLKHLDPVGTLMLFIVHIGWGKPVPVNPRNFEHPVRDSALVALAGPASNFVTAFVLAIPFKYVGALLPGFVVQLMDSVIHFSILLGVFNLLPLPPLDGSKILGLVIPKRWHYQYDRFLATGITYFILFILADSMFFSRYLGFSIMTFVVGNMYLFVRSLLFLGI